MRCMALDYGAKRTGVAFGVKDKRGFSVIPVKSIPSEKWSNLAVLIGDLREEFGAEKIIIGNPLSGGSRQNKISLEVVRFKSFLGKRVDVPIVLADERFSTNDATRRLKNKTTAAKDVDAVSAALILERYFENTAEV